MKKILIVEDDIDVSSNIAYMLTNSGYFVLVANDGAGGVRLVKENLPDLIIMDLMLPDIQGGEVVNIIKEYPPAKNIPVIFLTGLVSNQENKVGAETVNVNGKSYPALGKPFDFNKMLEIMNAQFN